MTAALEVPVEIAGQGCVLKFPAAALARYELAHGAIVGVLLKPSLTFGETAALLDAGLWHGKREMTLEIAAEMLEEHFCQTGKFTDVALRCLEAAWGSRLLRMLSAAAQGVTAE